MKIKANLAKELLRNKKLGFKTSKRKITQIYGDDKSKITSSWVENSIYNIMLRCLSRVDTKDRDILTLFRLLNLRFKCKNFTSYRNSKVKVQSELDMLLDILITEAGFCFLEEGNIDEICVGSVLLTQRTNRSK